MQNVSDIIQNHFYFVGIFAVNTICTFWIGYIRIGGHHQQKMVYEWSSMQIVRNKKNGLQLLNCKLMDLKILL